MIVGGLVAGLGVLGCAGLIGLAVFNAGSHSGWQTVNERGYSFKLPVGRVTRTPTLQGTGIKLVAQRRESGAMYGVEILTLPVDPPPEMGLEQLLEAGGSVLSGTRSVNRNGVMGIHGTVVSGALAPSGTQVEVFRVRSRMVFLYYTPFSIARETLKSTKAPRDNEEELDKPDEFFESLQFG